MQVSSASVTAMTKRLHGLDLVRWTPYRSITLTSTGERIAIQVVKRQRLLHVYLVEALGFAPFEAKEEVDRLVYCLSHTLETRLAAALGLPASDSPDVAVAGGGYDQGFNGSAMEHRRPLGTGQSTDGERG